MKVVAMWSRHASTLRSPVCPPAQQLAKSICYRVNCSHRQSDNPTWKTEQQNERLEIGSFLGFDGCGKCGYLRNLAHPAGFQRQIGAVIVRKNIGENGEKSFNSK